jgi:hypothetical protein
VRPSDPMPLAEAALALGRTYHQVRALVLRGDLKGGRDRAGRYYVERAAVQAAVRRQRRARRGDRRFGRKPVTNS